MNTQSKALRLADLIDPKKLGLEFVNAKNLSDAAAELRRLHQVEEAYIEWQDKTEWVQHSANFSELGMHRADVLKRRIDRLVQVNNELLDALQRIAQPAPVNSDCKISAAREALREIARSAIAKA